MPSQRVYFENEAGIRLAGIMDLPQETSKTFALFSHCFTCTKDLKAIVRISRGLARHGIGVLRFDFTGLGDSQGNFSKSNFESNLVDIQSAANWLRDNYSAPQLLLGLSLGGAAMMASTHAVESAKAIATLAAPSCTHHLAEFLAQTNPEIESSGAGEVVIGGRTHLMTSQLLDSLRRFDLKKEIEGIEIPHLILHSPADETLDYRHAEILFELTGGPKSLLTLSGADHLMVNQPQDVGYVADMIAGWTFRQLDF
ncbi:MAG: alpha/beta fold hydrolase [Planctomycetota bacterium]